MNKLTKLQLIRNKKEKDVRKLKKPFSELVPYYMTTGLKIKDLTLELD